MKLIDEVSWDAIIIGARCAGAATAMLLAGAGARVLVVDRDRPGTDTMSTHALMRSAVLQLERWGVADCLDRIGTPAVRTTSFVYGTEALDVDIRQIAGSDRLFAPRRTVLDQALVSAAWEAGAVVQFGTSFKGLISGPDNRVCGVRVRLPEGTVADLRAGIVIGADGRRSTVAAALGAQSTNEAKTTSAVAYSYWSGAPVQGYRWYWAENAAGGIIPTNDGLACVFVALRPETFAAELRGKGISAVRQVMAARLPQMALDLRMATPVTGPVAFSGFPGFVRECHGPGWALVGDAGYFKDPLTAHGISDALRDAEALAIAIARHDLPLYAHTRDRLSDGFFEITNQIASFDWSMDEIRDLHVSLNREMKKSQEWILGLYETRSAAA